MSKVSRRSSIVGAIICVLAALFYVYDYFVQVAPSVMVNNLMRDFHIDAARLGLLSAAFYYSYTLMQMPAGWLLDRLGARRLLSGSVLVSAVGMMLFSQAQALWMAGVGRFFIGMGSAFAFISTLFLIANWFSHKHFAFYAGLVQLGACVGSVVGLAPISLLVNQYGWRQTMLETGEVTLALAVIFWLCIRDHRDKSVVRVVQQDKTNNRFQLFRYPQVWWIAACGFISWVPVAVVGALWGVPFLQKVYHLSNTQAGRYCTLFWIGLGVGSPLMGWLSQRLQRRRIPFLLCFVIAMVSSAVFLLAPKLSITMTTIALFALGLSAAAQSLSFSVLKDVVPPSQFGFASGFNNMAAILGGAVSQPLVGFILHALWQGGYVDGVPFYTVHQYQYAMLILPIVGLVGCIVCGFMIRETYCQNFHHPLDHGVQQDQELLSV